MYYSTSDELHAYQMELKARRQRERKREWELELAGMRREARRLAERGEGNIVSRRNEVNALRGKAS